MLYSLLLIAPICNRLVLISSSFLRSIGTYVN